MIGEAKFIGRGVRVTYSDLKDSDHTKQKHFCNSEKKKKTQIFALRHSLKIPTTIT